MHFFGHRDCSASIQAELREALIALVEKHGVLKFLVGNQGNFDSIVLRTLMEIKESHPQIECLVVLAYMPASSAVAFRSETILPEGIENVPPRFAIARRNDWMLEQADYIVTYVTHSWGGAAKFAEKTRKLGKTVIALGT